jgi:hypothetical protein
MPVFEIGLEDGRKLHIEADDQQAALSGAQHFMDSEQPSGVVAGLRQGLSNLIQGPAETAKQYAGADTSALDAAAKKVATENYRPAPVLDKDGLHLSNLPQSVAEGVPGMAVDIAAAKAASKIPVVGKYAALPAGIASYLMRTRGQAAVERAANSQGEGATPTTGDKAAALATGLVESVPQALGISRFLPGSGALANGSKGVAQAVGRGVGTAATTGAAAGASDVIGQVGATIGTPGGVEVDPLRAGSSAITGATSGALLSSPRVGAEAHSAIKYSEITPEFRDAASRVANRMVDAADGANLAKPEHGLTALNKAEVGIKSELSSALSDLKTRVTLSPDAQNAFDSIQSGKKPTAREYDAIKQSVQSDPRGQQVLDLARDAHMMTVLKGTGRVKGEAFVGGAATKLASSMGLTQHGLAKGALAALAVEHFGSHLIAQSPAALAALGGTYLAARGLDKLSGARSPAQRFVNRFQNPTQGVRTPQAPLPTTPTRPTGPVVPPAPTPWGVEPPAPPDVRPQIQDVAALMAARRANDKLAKVADIASQKDVRDQVRDAAAQMAARRANDQVTRKQTTEQAKDATDLMAARRASVGMQVRDSVEQMNARRANAKLAQSANKADQAQFDAADGAHAAFDRQQARDATELMAARRANEKLTQTQAGRSQADALARTSPLIDEVGGLRAVQNPEFATTASKYIQAANAIKKLTAEPSEEGPGSPGVSKIKKANGKVKETAAPQSLPTQATRRSRREQMPYKGKSDEFKAQSELAKRQRRFNASSEVSRRRSSKRRRARRGAMAELAADHEADADTMASLLDQLHHIRRRSVAMNAVEHYARQMSPEAAAARACEVQHGVHQLDMVEVKTTRKPAGARKRSSRSKGKRTISKASATLKALWQTPEFRERMKARDEKIARLG